jgi:hypothetical protein
MANLTDGKAPDFVWVCFSNPMHTAAVMKCIEEENRETYLTATADFNGWTALHYAAAGGSEKWITAFINAGADTGAKSTKDFYYGVDDLVPKGSTPEEVAAIVEMSEEYRRAASLANPPANPFKVKATKRGVESEDDSSSQGGAQSKKGRKQPTQTKKKAAPTKKNVVTAKPKATKKAAPKKK